MKYRGMMPGKTMPIIPVLSHNQKLPKRIKPMRKINAILELDDEGLGALKAPLKRFSVSSCSVL